MVPFRKRVSTIEKLYLAYNGLRPPFANQVVVEGTGRIDAAALRAAVARATAVNPGARLAMSGRLGLRTWVPGPEPRVTLIANAAWDGRSGVGAPFLDAPLDPAGPTCELQVVAAGERTTLVFRSLHAGMDGVGTFLWAQEVFRALRGEPLVGHASALTDTELAAGLTDGSLALPPRDALGPCGRADTASSGKDFHWRRVTVTEPSATHTVAALLVALAAEARRHGTGVVRFNVPADLRFFRKDERSTGNAIGTLLVEVGPEATVDGVVRDLKERLRAREHARFPARYEELRWLPLGALTALIARGFEHEHTSGRYPLSATVSHLGTVLPEALTAPGFVPTAAFWIPPMADQICFVTCNRFGPNLELCLAMPRVLGTAGRFDALLARLTADVTSR